MINISENIVINNFAQKVASSLNLLEYDVDIKDATKNGDGYMGIVKLMQVKGKCANSDVIKIKNFIIKASFDDDLVRESLGTVQMYEREIFSYNNVFPNFMEFQNNKLIKKPFDNFPKCYTTSIENKKECLILENLKDSGFDLWGKNSLLDENHVVLILKTYARFHGLSFAIKDQNKKMFAEISKLPGVDQQLYEKIDFTGQIKKHVEKVINKLESDNKLDLLRKLKDLEANMNTLIWNILITPDDGKHVIIHGDCWYNNMMFKYDDNDKPEKPTDIRLLDFQTCRFSSPALDLSYFMYCNTPKEIFNNLDQYLHIYHDELCSFLEELGSGKDLYTFADLKEDWKTYSLFGLVVAFMFLAAMLNDRKNLTKFEESVKTGKNFIENMLEEIVDLTEYFVRIEDLLKHFVDNNII